jgi:hypothetical protein
VASVLGRRFSFGHLSAMLDEPPSALLTPVDELLRADLLTEDDGLLAYRHDLIREAVRDTLPLTALRALQRQAVDALLAAGSPPVEVAAQLAASAEPGDQAAVRTPREAARALGSSDPGAAADLTRRALELAGAGDPLRGPLAAETALLLHAAGRVEEAIWNAPRCGRARPRWPGPRRPSRNEQPSCAAPRSCGRNTATTSRAR